MKHFLETQVIGIIRGIDSSFFPDFMVASFAGGLRTLEVTANTKGGFDMVAMAADRVPAGCLLGMGTICTPLDAEKAIDNGATFLVTPNLDPDVIDFGVKHDVPVVAGALTPTEVFRAWQSGAAMVKVFPCGAMGGPKYIRELRGPFGHIPVTNHGMSHQGSARLPSSKRLQGAGDARHRSVMRTGVREQTDNAADSVPCDRLHIPLVPVGGVRQDNVADFFAAGANAVGVGLTLFGADAVEARDCDAITENVKKFFRCCPSP